LKLSALNIDAIYLKTLYLSSLETAFIPFYLKKSKSFCSGGTGAFNMISTT